VPNPGVPNAGVEDGVPNAGVEDGVPKAGVEDGVPKAGVEDGVPNMVEIEAPESEDSLKRESGQKVHLANIQFQASKSLIELSRTQDEEVGDGTTSVIVLGRFCKFYLMMDVMGVARNIHKNPKLVPGGGATELTVSATLKAEEFICTRHRKGTNASKTAIEAACMLLRIDDIVSGIKKKQGVPCYS
ncbi:T-complex protein 1 subunit gamma, partial [Linum perenne]